MLSNSSTPRALCVTLREGSGAPRLDLDPPDLALASVLTSGGWRMGGEGREGQRSCFYNRPLPVLETGLGVFLNPCIVQSSGPPQSCPVLSSPLYHAAVFFFCLHNVSVFEEVCGDFRGQGRGIWWFMGTGKKCVVL